MRYSWLSLLALLCVTTLALAQQPPPPLPKLDPDKNPLDAVLIQWETAMSSISTLHTKMVRTSVDKTLGGVVVCEGEAKFLKPNKASYWLQNSKKPQEFERMLFNAQFVYRWEPGEKEIHRYELPKAQQAQVNDDNVVSFMFGMKAAQAKARYKMDLSNTDASYYYIDVYPVAVADKSEFSRARLVLVKKTGLPRQLWFEQPNQNETTYDFTQMKTNIPVGAGKDQLDPREFEQPTPPAGWKLKNAPLPPGQPRVVRPQG
jgi:TIGR03009 family protein